MSLRLLAEWQPPQNAADSSDSVKKRKHFPAVI